MNTRTPRPSVTARRFRTRRPNGAGQHPVRSVRISEETWARARARAVRDGASMSQVVTDLVEQYAEGAVGLRPPAVSRVGV